MVAGILTLILGENEIVDKVFGGLAVIVPAVAYCIVEGSIDRTNVKTVVEATKDTAEKLGASDKVTDIFNSFGDVVDAVLPEEEKKTDDQ